MLTLHRRPILDCFSIYKNLVDVSVRNVTYNLLVGLYNKKQV